MRRVLSPGMAYRAGALAVSLAIILILVAVSGKPPLDVLGALVNGAFGTEDQTGRVFATLVPLLLCSSGLAFTFVAGLYNLGVEGQVIAGAVATTLVLRTLQNTALPAEIVMALGIVGGALGGVAWGMAGGALSVFGRISEIFIGLGMNFVATGMAIYLVFGPWKRPGVASLSGTEPFDQRLWLGTFGRTEAAPAALVIALAGLLATIIILRGTSFGLRLRAVGLNLRASGVLGIPAARQLLASFAICGLFAGLAGALQVLGIFHRLVPGVSGNLGFLSLLVVMLVNFNPVWILPVAAFFSALNVGSLRLPLNFQLESALAGVIQGLLVLAALIGRGLSERFGKSRSG